MKKLLLILSLFAVNVCYSQFSYVAANAINTAGTYTDLGLNGTVIATTDFDEANSTPQNIGFSFFYNGTAFTQFVLNTNGLIKLGATAPADVQIYNALTSTETNLIYPLNLDLQGGTAPEYRVFTSGAAPNRVCTIQFKNVSDYYGLPATAPQFADMDFQIKLYETTNTIEFVYGAFIAGAAADAVTIIKAGIKGNDAVSSVNVTKASATAWSAGTFINDNYTNNSFNIRKTVLPVPGRTFRFVSPSNDAQVSNIYTLGKIPVTYGSPHIVKALIKNGGSNAFTNLAVNLNVTGANTFTNLQTIPSLPPGASVMVSFTAYSPAVIGTNTVTVSIAADGNNTNNTVVYTQAVTAGIFSYADNFTNSGAIGYNTAAGLIVNKYTLTGNAYVTNVNVFIPNATTNTGNTVYAVVLDALGTIVAQSPNYVILAGDLGTYKSFLFAVSPLVNGTDFFVGLAQTANATTGYFPVGTQAEPFSRAGAYFTAPLAGGAAPVANTTLGRFMIEAVVASTALANNDAQVSNVYTLGKIPVAYGSPHIVKALVRNAGASTINNLAVTLNVTGANTFSNLQTVTSLAPGASATVSFAGYSPANIGTNTVTVNVAADDNNTNNSVLYTQVVTAGTFSYADNATNSGAIGYNNAAGLIVNKYTLTGSAYATNVNIFIPNAASNTGNTIYAVVLNTAGTIIGQSANYVIAAGDLGTYKSLPITTAPLIANADFFVGLAQTANATTGYFPVGIQAELSTRAGAYYTAPLAGGTAPVENATLGRFMIEAVVAASPLPVKLSGFSGRIQNNSAFLNWFTSFESNNDRFEIEKSLSGSETWLKIGTVTAVGNSTVNNKYQFTDAGLSNGSWMYRLKIYDKDGKFTYSQVVILQLTGKSMFVLEQNYPNPVTDVTMIRYELGKDAMVTIELYSMDGKKILAQQKGKQLKGSYNSPLDAVSLGLSSGKYVYRMIVQDLATGEITAYKKEMNVIR
ncbi:MAG: T9SS type A sorting domain-containing protein [Ferruginibacter sp.]|nr:T9SS type A sorting domain-containing protein [Ferruginibacter sp.]